MESGEEGIRFKEEDGEDNGYYDVEIEDDSTDTAPHLDLLRNSK